MTATVQDIENAIIAKLQEALPGLSAEAFPERPEEYDLLHPVGAVLVQYEGGTYSGNALSNGIAQIKTLRFSVVTLVRNLRSSDGCYAAMQAVADALTGFVIPGTVRPMAVVSERFNTEYDGVWSYVQTVETSVRIAAQCHQ
ncbi:hypothetical protein IJT17_00635 [bacterium]|nr:hypothetical protein [bacterium]